MIVMNRSKYGAERNFVIVARFRGCVRRNTAVTLLRVACKPRYSSPLSLFLSLSLSLFSLLSLSL